MTTTLAATTPEKHRRKRSNQDSIRAREKRANFELYGTSTDLSEGIFRLLPICSFQLERHVGVNFSTTHHFQRRQRLALFHTSKGIHVDHGNGSHKERPEGTSGKLCHGDWSEKKCDGFAWRESGSRQQYP
jgi:hypothetical protein